MRLRMRAIASRIQAGYIMVMPRQHPLLCAGLIGYRALKKTGDAERVGIYGFGAAAHIAAQVLRHQGASFLHFTRPGDSMAQAFSIQMGATWAGGSDTSPPGGARCSDNLCPGRGAGAHRTTRCSPGRNCRVRGDTHERYPVFSLRHPLAREMCGFGRQPHAQRRGRVFDSGSKSTDPGHHSSFSRWSRRIRPWSICGMAS